MSKLKVIVSGGGTGGHIFPAIAIANKIKELEPEAEILFVGAKGRMEMEKVPAAGYPIEGLWISGLQRRITLKNLLFPFKVIFSLIKARKIINSFKPDVVIGTGGYASGPTLRAASARGIPTIIQEQNSYPGITNKLLAKKVNCICVAYEGMERYFPKEKITVTGNPVRNDILSLHGKREPACKHFNLDPAKKTILIIGGSLGARSINLAIGAGLEKLTAENTQILWQTGMSFYETAKNLSINQPQVHPHAFIREMDLAYACADIVISRAGASSISELALVNKPCILIPSPNVAEDHQTKNAMALVNKQAALLIKDAEAMDKLCDTAIELLHNEQLKDLLTKNISQLGHPESATRIAKLAIQMADRK